MNVVVLYHANCNDGFCCAWIMKNIESLRDSMFIPVSHGQPVPIAVGEADLIYIVDFSYKRDVIDALRASGRRVVVLDHHKSAQDELSPHPDTVFDTSRSGAQIVWDYFHDTPATRHWLVTYTADRDLWQWKEWKSAEVNAAIQLYPRDFATWDMLAKRACGELEAEGVIILRYQRSIIDSALGRANTGNELKIDGSWLRFSYAIVNSTVLFSEIAGELCETLGVDVGICWFQRKDGKYQLSIRSRSAEGRAMSALAVAKALGGGGHPNAAGCELTSMEIFHV